MKENVKGPIHKFKKIIYHALTLLHYLNQTMAPMELDVTQKIANPVKCSSLLNNTQVHKYCHFTIHLKKILWRSISPKKHMSFFAVEGSKSWSQIQVKDVFDLNLKLKPSQAKLDFFNAWLIKAILIICVI